jgi:hypothetical protein
MYLTAPLNAQARSKVHTGTFHRIEWWITGPQMMKEWARIRSKRAPGGPVGASRILHLPIIVVFPVVSSLTRLRLCRMIRNYPVIIGALTDGTNRGPPGTSWLRARLRLTIATGPAPLRPCWKTIRLVPGSCGVRGFTEAKRCVLFWLGAPVTLQGPAQVLPASCRGEDPRSLYPRRLVPYMLRVATGQVRYPVPNVVLMKTHNGLLHICPPT